MTEAPTLMVIPITGHHDVYGAVMRARWWMESHGRDTVEAHRLATVVSELATNIVKYGTRGDIRLTRLASPRPGVEVQAVDEGPGIADVSRALQDHYSTSGTLGLGLPGVKRMTDELVIDTGPRGTTVTARTWW